MKRLPSGLFSKNIKPSAIILFIIIFTFLLLFITKSAQQTRDSLVYAQSAKTGVDMFHPHHLLYTPVIHAVFLLLSPRCPSCDAIFAGQFHNILWATAAILSFFLIVKHLLGSTLLSLLGAILLLVTRGFWELSTQTTMYVPAASILALLVAILLVRREGRLAFGRATMIMLLFALSVLYHQANILFALPLGYYLLTTEGKQGWKVAAGIIFVAGIVVLSVYILVFISTQGVWSIGEFIRFCLSYTSQICLGGQCTVRPDNWGTVNNLGMAGIRSLIESLLWNFIISPQSLNFVFIPLFTLSIIILIIWNIRQVIKRAAYGQMRGFLLVWLMSYVLFFFWWLPDYQHPFVITLLPILLLLLLTLRDSIGWLVGPLGFTQYLSLGNKAINPNAINFLAATALLFVILIFSARNFYVTIFPLQQFESDSYLEASELMVKVPQNCIILTNYRVWNHLRYYFDREEGTIQGRHPLSHFYQQIPLPELYHFNNEACVAVLAEYVDPNYNLEGFTAFAANGYSEPAAWLAYMGWLFDFEHDANNKLVVSREFKIITLSEGDPYIFFLPSKKKVNGLGELFQNLDNQINGHLDAEENSFQSWLITAHVEN